MCFLALSLENGKPIMKHMSLELSRQEVVISYDLWDDFARDFCLRGSVSEVGKRIYPPFEIGDGVSALLTKLISVLYGFCREADKLRFLIETPLATIMKQW